MDAEVYPVSVEGEGAKSLGSYGHRMLNRMMKKTTQGMELESLKKEHQDILDENSQLKERIAELETKVREILSSSLTVWSLRWSKCKRLKFRRSQV